MGSKLVDSSTLNLDTSILSNFIYEWNISRRNIFTYPQDHPLIGQSADKLLTLLEQLLEFRSAITLGVAKESLLIGNAFFDRRNPVYQDFARTLFSMGIVSLTVRRGLNAEQLHTFNRILTRKREEIEDCGGIEQVLVGEGIRHIMVEQVDYQAFQTTEEERVDASWRHGGPERRSDLWSDLVKGLLEGSLDPEGTCAPAASALDASALAELINRQSGESSTGGRQRHYQDCISDFIRNLSEKGVDLKRRNPQLEQFCSLVGELHPDLRRQFLNSTFEAVGEQSEVAEELAGRLPQSSVLEALQEVNARRAIVSPTVLKLLEKLASQHKGAEVAPLPSHQARDAGQEGQKLRVLFREEDAGQFVPGDYQQVLDGILSTQDLSAQELEEIETLKQSLEGHCLETQVSSVILELVRLAPDAEQAEVLKRNLFDLCEYFLAVGDFSSLMEVYRRLGEQQPSSLGAGHALRSEVLKVFSEPRFIEGVLDALRGLGKQKYEEIAAVIQLVGAPFVEPIFNRLADESSMSLRRYYMAQLARLGDSVREAALLRLRDKRWYFVRNLVVSLRNLQDPRVVEAIRQLRDHPHHQVRLEVARTLLHFNDAEATRLLIQDLTSGKRERQMAALNLADRSSAPEVFQTLLGLLVQGSFSAPELELKSAVLKIVTEKGNTQALPVLGEIFNQRNLFRRKNHLAFRLEILRSLEAYPFESVGWVLERLCGAGQMEVAELARTILGRLQEDRC